MASAAAETTVTSVTLELSSNEASALAAVLATVGGSPTNSARKHTAAVSEALRGAGFGYTGNKYNKYRDGTFFNDFVKGDS